MLTPGVDIIDVKGIDEHLGTVESHLLRSNSMLLMGG